MFIPKLKYYFRWELLASFCGDTPVVRSSVDFQDSLFESCMFVSTPPGSYDLGIRFKCSTRLISHCNVTGEWQLFDRNIDAACQHPLLGTVGNILSWTNLIAALQLCLKWVFYFNNNPVKILITILSALPSNVPFPCYYLILSFALILSYCNQSSISYLL